MKNILNINFDYSMISLDERNSLNEKIKEIHSAIQNRTGEGNELMDWLTWPVNNDNQELEEIISTANSLKEMGVEKLLVIGVGGSYLGSKSAIDFLKGNMNMQNEIIFAGLNLSGSHIKQIEGQLEGSKFAICVISKSGTTLETSIAFRHFKNILEQKEGKEKSKDLVIAITDKENGLLKDIAEKEGYKMFSIPKGIGGRFSATTAVGTFPMAFAGIDVRKIIKGSKIAMEELSQLENNMAYEYALTRFILNKDKNKVSEIFTTYDFDLESTLEWLKQLFGESEGKEGKGIFPMSAIYTRDLHSLGQIIQEGNKNFFETTIWIKEDAEEIKIISTEDDLDKLNYLEGKTIHQLNKNAFDGVLKAHYEEGGIPNIVIELEEKNELSLGYLWYFFFITVTASCYLQGVNPFNQPGVEQYKKYMNDNLNK